MIWASLLLIIGLAAAGGWAWYTVRRQLAVTSEAQQRRLLRQRASVSAGVSVAILITGAAAFAATGHNWFVLAVTWSYGLLRIALLGMTLRRAQMRTGRTRLPR